MADAALPALQAQQQQQQQQPIPPPLLPQPSQLVNLHMNWSHFKPEYSGKPEEDVEAHLLRTNDWMNTHAFPDGVNVQRFCLTLTGEARLSYASLEAIVMKWQELQNQFRRQYSKLGNTREQLFYAWRSFHYDENVEMPDVYVIRIRQVVRLLGYGKLQVLEVFKNTVPNRLYWVLFPIDNLGEAVETAKRFLTKEKIDRQMTGQSSTPFMKLSDKKRGKTVLFNARDVLERNSENMEQMATALMEKMYIKLDQKDMSYKPQIYQKEEEVRTGETSDRIITIGEEMDHLVENEVIIVIEVIVEVEVILEEVVFEVGPVVILEEIIVGIEIEKTGDLGDSLDQEKEE